MARATTVEYLGIILPTCPFAKAECARAVQWAHSRLSRIPNGTLTSSTVFVYDASGQLMAEYTTPNPVGNGRQYLTQDHLGSTRLVTKSNGTATDIVFSRHDFMPFGEELARGANAYGPSALSMKFTGKERDAETGLDYFGARYFGAAPGRFTSPDEPLADQDAANPQSWNLYSYVRNKAFKVPGTITFFR